MNGRRAYPRARTVALACLVILSTPVAVVAQSVLFIDSSPIRAEATINGVSYGTTPLLVRDLPAGVYEITLFKPGHRPATERIELGASETAAIVLNPQPDLFVGAFSARETIVDGTAYPRQEAVFTLPAGTYELSGDRDRMRLTPLYPDEGALRAARIVTLVGGVAALLSVVEDLFVDDGRSFFTSYLPSPASITMLTVAAGAGGFWLALAAEKRRYEQTTVIEPFAGSLTAARAEELYVEAEAALEAGNLSRALASYARVVADGGDSGYVPDALYKSAQIYSTSGDIELASRLLDRLVTDYPSPSLFDRALKLLADLLVVQGRYEEAIVWLERMVFLDPLYLREDIEQDIRDIRALVEEGAS